MSKAVRSMGGSIAEEAKFADRIYKMNKITKAGMARLCRSHLVNPVQLHENPPVAPNLLTTISARSLAQLASSIGPVWKLKNESGLPEPGRDHAAALEDQFGFTLQNKRAEFQHPLSCRQPEGHAPRGSQHAHEF